MLLYNHQEEIRPVSKKEPTHYSTSIELMKEREVFIMKKILDKVSEFFKEYYVSFGERI